METHEETEPINEETEKANVQKTYKEKTKNKDKEKTGKNNKRSKLVVTYNNAIEEDDITMMESLEKMEHINEETEKSRFTKDIQRKY